MLQRLGKPLYYRYTNPAGLLTGVLYQTQMENSSPFLSTRRAPAGNGAASRRGQWRGLACSVNHGADARPTRTAFAQTKGGACVFLSLRGGRRPTRQSSPATYCTTIPEGIATPVCALVRNDKRMQAPPYKLREGSKLPGTASAPKLRSTKDSPSSPGTARSGERRPPKFRSTKDTP